MFHTILTATVPDWAVAPFLVVGGGGAVLMVLSGWLLLRVMGASDPVYRRWATLLETGFWVGMLWIVIAVMAVVIAAVQGP